MRLAVNIFNIQWQYSAIHGDRNLQQPKRQDRQVFRKRSPVAACSLSRACIVDEDSAAKRHGRQSNVDDTCNITMNLLDRFYPEWQIIITASSTDVIFVIPVSPVKKRCYDAKTDWCTPSALRKPLLWRAASDPSLLDRTLRGYCGYVTLLM